MPWTDRFYNKLQDATYRPMFIIRSVDRVSGVAAPWAIQSPGAAYWGLPVVSSVASTGARVSVGDWSSNIGTMSIGLTGDHAGFFRWLFRGQVVEVRMGFAGDNESQYQTIFVGSIWDLTRNGRGLSWTLTLRSLWASLNTRLTTTTDEHALFHDLPSSTLSAAYTAGDPTITITDGTEWPREDSGTGMIRVTPDSGGDFYLGWTSSVADKLGRIYTLDGAGAYFGSTDANASSGNACSAVAYINDHPLEAVRKILVSSGTLNQNGDYDTLPASWGYGLPERLIDGADMDYLKAFCAPSSGSENWQIYSDASQPTPFSWIKDTVLKPAGFFPTMRQGLLTIRAAVHPYATVNQAKGQIWNSSTRLDESNFAREPIVQYSAWDPGYRAEYQQVDVTTDGGTTSTSETVESIPNGGDITIDCSAFVWENEGAWRGSIGNRMAIWYTRIPERYTVSLVGMHHARSAPGDIVRLTSHLLAGRLAPEGFREAPVYLTQVGVNWTRRTVTLSFTYTPIAAIRFP